jgi:biopolymer transport protein ExbD
MSWQVRHEGSPRTIDGLTLQQVLDGLAEGQWEPTDEVRGPGDADWQPLGDHPRTADAALDVEPPPPDHGDETHLDFNALIDVCLVLLIFFIIISAVVKLQLRLEAPNVTGDAGKGPLAVTREEVGQTMLKVTIEMAGGRPVTKLEGQEVSGDDLARQLRRYVRSTGKTQLVIEHQPNVPYGSVVAVQDAARSVGMEKVWILVPPEELKSEGGSPGG